MIFIFTLLSEYLANSAPVTLYGIGSVKTHASTGHVSVKVWYSGPWTDSTYWTERWFLQPVDGGFVVDHYEGLTLKGLESLSPGPRTSSWRMMV